MILINGAPTRQIEVADRGFQYGDGVFTTVAVKRGIPLFLSLHIGRLQRDSATLLIPFPAEELLSREAHDLSHGCADGALKIQLTRGAGGRGYRLPETPVMTRVLSLHPAPASPSNLGDGGIRLTLCKTRLGLNPALAGVKHMNRLEQVMARAEWQASDIDEGLMLDSEGNVVEGTMSNLFIVRGRRLYTPLIDRCGVAGIMRSIVIDCARENGIELAEIRLRLDDIRQADEVFLTNCLIGLWPVRRFEDAYFTVGPVGRAVAGWIKAKTDRELTLACHV
jgi:4-amino-4-deoxychorismate lyase